MITYYTKSKPVTSTQKYDWSSFTLRISIDQDWPKIYRAWTTRQGLEKWFLREAKFNNSHGDSRKKTEFIHTGDTYKWLWYGYLDDTFESGEIMEANGTDFIQFSFSGGTIVTVQLKSEYGHSVVELTQENISIDEESKAKYHLGCLTGWNFYLANLKSILEGGLDLRNKDHMIKRVINS